MAEIKVHLDVLISSPSDVMEERDVIVQVINELNIELRKLTPIHLEPIRWESHAYSEVGVSAQGAINKQLGTSFDVYIGVLWHRFGTPTEAALSGTQEEFNNAYAKYKTNNKSCRIMIFNKTAPLDQRRLDADELQKKMGFLTELRSNGLISDFNNIAELQKILRRALIGIIESWGREWGEGIEKLAKKAIEKVSSAPASEIEKNG